MEKFTKETISRTSPRGTSRRVYHGLACEYKTCESEYTSIVTDLSKGEVITVDHMVRLEEIFKVIYLGKTIKVILKDKDGTQFIGISRCQDGDYFSPQTGYDIAWRRAKIKQMEYRIKELSDLK